MIDLRALAVPAFGGLAAWQLWRAYSRGEVILSHGAVIRRADAPMKFWWIVAFNGLVVAAVATLGGVLMYRAVFPPPLAERIAALYPPAAARQGVEGAALLSCTITSSYAVKDCRVLSESPPAAGFGPAALKIASFYIVPVADRPKVQPGATLRLPIRFKLPEPDGRGPPA